MISFREDDSVRNCHRRRSGGNTLALEPWRGDRLSCSFGTLRVVMRQIFIKILASIWHRFSGLQMDFECGSKWLTGRHVTISQAD